MRKRHQKMLLELLGTLGRTNGKIAKLPPSNAAAITNLLADCQDCAEQIFDFVEQLEGEGTKTASYIKEYYELLYQASTELKGFEKLQKQIEKIEASVRSDLKPNKIEIAFFPYKASMWDSLESIWLAAKDDPACDAYVVPIPYYEKQSNGAFGRMRYEGGEYPSYVPVVDWQKYNAEERRPDAIFIHNPYDGGNYVTSVHPDFYSEKLRGFTDMLCYVPYFVCGGDEVGEHFATTLGCVYAHKVIVQSEKIRDSYIRAFKKQYGGRLGRPEDKFVALGSPKFDKAVNSRREDFALPEDWRKIIDGKKVVLYNTTIGALLEGNEKYLQKIRSVLDAFRNRDDVALLWRPHPLNEATYRTMRPQLLNEYGRIVEEYRREGWGIYDDTADLHRAIAVSDGYYGDMSSLVAIYGVTKKPVQYQLLKAPDIFGIYADKNFVWFMDCSNLLYKYNEQNKETECVGTIKEKSDYAYFGIAENNGKLYFAPYCKNDEIGIYDIEKKVFERISLIDNCKYDYKFSGVISFKNFIYFIPTTFPAIVRLNSDTNEITYFSEWANDVSKQQVSKIPEAAWENIIFWSSCVANEEIALIIHGANAIMLFNMETGTYEIRNIGEKSEQYVTTCFDGQNYYISSTYKDYIVKWNRISNETFKIKLPVSFSRKQSIYCNFYAYYLRGYVFLIPNVANNAYKINIDTNEITELPELIEHFEDKNIYSYYNSNIIAKGNCIYICATNKGIVEYNTDTRELNFIDDYKENTEMNILFSSMNDCEHDLNKIDVKSENAGEKIYAYFKKEVFS